MSINEKPKKNKFWKSLNLFLALAVFLGGAYFLKSIDDLMNKNLELELLNNKVNLLKEEQRELENDKNILESYENINSRLSELGMIKVGDINYLDISDDSLAKK